MSYRSDVVIGINKEILARHLLVPEIPECLGEPNNTTEEAVYWFISNWKWYSSYPDIAAIEKWFNSMSFEEFGALRIGEEDTDIEEWGSPYTFDIYVNRSLVYPGAN